ncbi:hypothetical protein IscW_ISCW003189 [Ixodes scapularis]|uniref:Uncharacterized protein n=1 Tax=Ixodes scapularis TaxID=6945 RepID=B7P926_IXOSC|nr:hypothetical protein IscW_ISCW003189 [Ixodes scapularis]|eukprot:XP_002403558.1 hypothetical protein IscW_ISCW003189 [Ixodes scapularis]
MNVSAAASGTAFCNIRKDHEFRAQLEEALGSPHNQFRGLSELLGDCAHFSRTGAVRTRDVLLAMAQLDLGGWPDPPPLLDSRNLLERIVRLDLRYRVGAWTRLRVDAANETGGALRSFLDVPAFWDAHFEQDWDKYRDHVTHLLAMFGAGPQAAAAVTALERRLWTMVRRTNGRSVLQFPEGAAVSGHSNGFEPPLNNP